MRSAVVSGGASGMGLACVRRYRTEGFGVTCLDLVACPEADVTSIFVDVTDAAAVRAAGNGLSDVAVLVNAAGVYPPTTLATATVELYRRVFDVNVLGTVLVTQAIVPRMAVGGAIVNFASIDAYEPSPGQLLYSAAKAAIVQLTRSLAQELAPGIRVNAIAPGWVKTPGTAANDRLTEAIDAIPLRRAATPDEMADLVYLLAGEGRALYVTGETLIASGGLVFG